MYTGTELFYHFYIGYKWDLKIELFPMLWDISGKKRVTI